MQATSSRPEDVAEATGIESWQHLAEVEPNGVFPARARYGTESIVIFRTKHGYRGTSRACPHMFATMLKAELAVNETMVRCPLHVFTFRLSDGKGVNCPGFQLDIYEVEEREGALYARAVV